MGAPAVDLDSDAGPPSPPANSGSPSGKQRPQWFLYQWLDVQDHLGTWLEAQVTDLDRGVDPHGLSGPGNSPGREDGGGEPTGVSLKVRRIFVHYKGFKSIYDEWIDVSSGSNPRVAALHTHTRRPALAAAAGVATLDGSRLVPGDRLDVQDSLGKWYASTVLRTDPALGLVLIHYEGWKSEFDEWINTESYRLAPLYLHTNPQLFRDLASGRLQLPHDGHHRRGLVHHEELKQGLPGDGGRQQQPWAGVDLRATSRIPQLLPLPPAVAAPSPTAFSSSSSSSSSSPHSSLASSPADQDEYAGLSDKERVWREKLLRTHGWRIAVQRGDGNCLFRSVSHQVYGDPEHHAVVREKVVAYLRRERGYFQGYVAGDFDQHLAAMARDGVWGDHLEIQAMAEMYNRPIEIYAYGTRPYKTFPCGPKGAQPLRLSYHLRSHYNSIDWPELGLHILRTPPGVAEDQALRQHRVQAPDAGEEADAELRRVERLSELEALEEQDVRLALQRSRQCFQRQDVDSFDAAVQESVQLAEARFREQLSSALETSERELLDRVRQESLRDAPGVLGATGGLGLGLGLGDDEDADVMMLGVEDAVAAVAEAEAAELAAVTAESAAAAAAPSSGALAPATANELARPIKMCMEMGYTLEQAARAYSALEALGLDDQTMVGMMQEHIMDHLAQFQL